MKKNDYVHGYSPRESVRLFDQANTLAELLHIDTLYAPGSRVLEAGCGVGAQTLILARNNPDVQITSIDVSLDSIKQAKVLMDKEGILNVEFKVADIFNLPFADDSFDHVFICFVLEHLKDPLKALLCLKRILKNEGSITVIEGDHGSCYFHPESKEALQTWQCLIRVQQHLKCNPLMGREIYPLLDAADFKNIHVSPKIVYIDSSKPELVEGFIKRTIIPMVEGVREQAIDLGIIDEKSWDKGIKDLHKTSALGGVFFYNFFKGIGIK